MLLGIGDGVVQMWIFEIMPVPVCPGRHRRYRAPPDPLVLIFAFLRLAPPHHAGDPREGFGGGLPYHSAYVFLQFLSFAFFLAS